MHSLPFASGLLLAVLVFGWSLPARSELSWIWASQPGTSPVSMRREFDLENAPREAVLFVTCDNGARVFINDQLVATSEDWNTPSKAEVTQHLKTGKNVIRAEAVNEGGPAGFVAKLVMRIRGNRELVIETDGAWQVQAGAASPWQAATVVERYGAEPWGDALGLTSGRSLVVQPSDLQVLPGFRVDLIHVVPKAEDGSWVSMTVDPKGRILACDQYGALYRLTPPPVDATGETQPHIEKLHSRVGGAHGLLYAFDSLYVMVNEQSGRQGLWRLRDTDGDGQFDDEQLLRRIEGSGEHGPHAIVLSPDGQSLHVISGNHTKLPAKMELSRAARAWDEDQIIPRLWDANGHARGILAPGGYICRTDPEGKVFELVSAGYRNAYDFAFNDLGDIITYDSDMEWDAGLPWYRPTRICLATSGSELGWRSGSGKWPDYYPDSLPAILDIGPGSPTGVEAGRGAKFPARYQQAVFANDWTYGTMYAVHLAPDGAGYRATREEFVSGKPLPLTDLTVNPRDGALYFAIGGRRTQSAVYRIVYVGNESTAPATPPQPTPELKLRRELEVLHRDGTGPTAISLAWPHLAHRDRWVRFAARVAIERQPAASWAERALTEERPWAIIESAVALARVGAKDHRSSLLERLHRLDFASLDLSAQLALLRAYQLTVTRWGAPEGAVRDRLIARIDRLFPAANRDLNRELANLLLALDAPTAVPKTLQLMATARDEDVRYASDALLARNTGYASAFSKASASRPNQQQIAYAYALRIARSGWTSGLRRAYFDWFPSTAAWEGGNSFRGFLEIIRKEALQNVPDPTERAALDALSIRQPAAGDVPEFAPPKGPGRDYSVDDVVAQAAQPLRQRNFEDGRRLFHAAACYSCHRFNGSGGGAGPDLTESGSRFSLRDLVENIVEPSKVISDQYGSELVELHNGSTLIGRAYAEGDRIVVVYDPRNPDEKESAPLDQVKSRTPYPVSLMPQGLLNSMNPDEVLNLLAYILSAGNPQNPMFAR